MIHSLCVKQHNKTLLKYLCKTIKNPYRYRGSGKYWKRHIKIHGNDISTYIIGTYKTKEELKEAGIYYSHTWNVVESDEWANLKIEEGDGGGDGKHNIGRKRPDARRRMVEKNPTKNPKTIKKMIDAKAKYWPLINPQGEKVLVYNLKIFCKENNLNYGHLWEVVMNSKRRKSHKGWKHK